MIAEKVLTNKVQELEARVIALSERVAWLRGCVCPPGSESTCQGPNCPRRNPFKLTWTDSEQLGPKWD